MCWMELGIVVKDTERNTSCFLSCSSHAFQLGVGFKTAAFWHTPLIHRQFLQKGKHTFLVFWYHLNFWVSLAMLTVLFSSMCFDGHVRIYQKYVLFYMSSKIMFIFNFCRHLNIAKEGFTQTSLGLLANQRKRQLLIGLLKSLRTIKTLVCTVLFVQWQKIFLHFYVVITFFFF